MQHDRHPHRAWLAEVASAPHLHGFYPLLRALEARHPHLPRLGEAARPADEPWRIGQPAELGFAAASLAALELDGPRPRLQQRLFGLLGPHGPLPTHLTELARERWQHQGDLGLQRFLELLTHRLALLFYRAWAQAQPALDRPGDHGFAQRLGGLYGGGLESMRGRDALSDASRLFFCGRLARQVRDAGGLLEWCRAEFQVPVAVRRWVGHWMPLGREERTRLRQRAEAAGCLGRGAVLGGAVWDVQHRFRIVVGPLPLARYRDFLPGGEALARLRALVRQWVGLEFAWDLQLVLQRADIPALRLGGKTPLGQLAWLGRRPHARDAADLVLAPETQGAADGR